MLVVRSAAGQGGWGNEVLHHAAFFYAEKILVASMDQVRLQGSFDTLTRLFNRVGVRTNFRKTVRILCRHFHVVSTQ